MCTEAVGGRVGDVSMWGGGVALTPRPSPQRAGGHLMGPASMGERWRAL